MKISPYNFSPNFTARKKEIREADKMERQTKQVFPMFSSTYAETFYTSAKPPRRNERAIEITKHQKDKINGLRDYAYLYSHNYRALPVNLKSVEVMKRALAGNCSENADAALTVLCANGYYNSEIVSLGYRVNFVNKKTGETEYSNLFPLDHNFVLTDMVKNPDPAKPRGKRNIVVDPWLGFADSKEGATAKFKQIYTERDYREAISIFKGLFCCDKKMNYDEFGEKYDVKAKMEFTPKSNYMSLYEAKELGIAARKEFEGIAIDN